MAQKRNLSSLNGREMCEKSYSRAYARSLDYILQEFRNNFQRISRWLINVKARRDYFIKGDGTSRLNHTALTGTIDAPRTFLIIK